MDVGSGLEEGLDSPDVATAGGDHQRSVWRGPAAVRVGAAGEEVAGGLEVARGDGIPEGPFGVHGRAMVGSGTGMHKPVGVAGSRDDRVEVGHEVMGRTRCHQVAVDDHVARIGDKDGPGVDDVGQHNGVAHHPTAAEQLRLGGQEPKAVAHRSLDDPGIPHRLGEELHRRRRARQVRRSETPHRRNLTEPYRDVVRAADDDVVVVRVCLRDAAINRQAVDACHGAVGVVDVVDEIL